MMDETPVSNITVLDGGGQKDKALQVARDLKALLPAMIENAVLVARLRRASYLALVNEGFTEAQALELCRHI